MRLWHTLLPGVVLTTYEAAASALQPPELAWNLAFGANMDEGTRARRGLRPRAMIPACAPGWELVFSLAGVPFLEPAFAAVRPALPGSGVSVHGVCLQLDREGWLRLLQSEGALDGATALRLQSRKASLQDILAEAQARRPSERRGYRLQEVSVEPYPVASRGPLPSKAYVLTDIDGPLNGSVIGPTVEEDLGAATRFSRGGFVPSERYWRLLRNGARRHGLRDDYRRFLWSLPRFSPSPLALAALVATAPAFLTAAAAATASSQTVGSVRRNSNGQVSSNWPSVPRMLSATQGQVKLGPPVSDTTWA